MFIGIKYVLCKLVTVLQMKFMLNLSVFALTLRFDALIFNVGMDCRKSIRRLTAVFKSLGPALLAGLIFVRGLISGNLRLA
jgi:hypothetical protein